MAKIGKEIIDKILDTARIEEVIQDCLGSYSSQNKAGLKKTGIRYKALCPFHDDKNLGSFIVYPRGNCYKCFACGEGGGVIDFLMKHENLTYPDAIRWLGKKYDIPVDDVPVDWTYTPRPAPPPLPMLEIPMKIVTSREKTEGDNLINWMRSIPWDDCQRKRLTEVLKEYHVGHARQGHTIFWQIDDTVNVRTGKMMKYKPDGHRDKESKYNFDWIHSALFRDPRQTAYDEDKQQCIQTLFGMHLLNKYPKASVNIVESEKTAIIMATAYGNNFMQVWMACGGKENLNHERLAPILKQNRRIILYPDRDAVTEWRAKAENLHYDRITVNVQAVNDWWQPQDGEKADIADVVVRMLMNHSEPPRVTVGELMKQNPAVKTLVEKFNLTEDNNERAKD